MKSIIAILLVACVTLLGKDSRFQLASNHLKATASTRGGSLLHLTLRGDSMVFDENEQLNSFTEKALVADGNRQIVEDFSGLDFLVLDAKEDEITFSASGIKAFNWLRITKRYQLDGDRQNLTVTWKLTNVHDRPHAVGLWQRTMLRKHHAPGMSNEFFFPHDGIIQTLTHPGSVKDDFWILKPDRAFLAFAGQADGRGGILLLPPRLVTAYYSWLSATGCHSTLEWFLREQTIRPGKSKTFTVRICFRENIRELLRKEAMTTRLLSPGRGKEPILPRMHAMKDHAIQADFGKAGPMPVSRRHMDIRGKRQFNPSVRAVRLPPDLDCSTLSVYELANRNPQFDRPVPFRIRRLPNGEQQVLLAVPGIHDKGFYYTTFRDGYAWESQADDKRPQGKFLGPDSFSYRLCLDRRQPSPIGHDRLFRNGPNLVYNGGFERKDDQHDWPDGYYWTHAVRWRKIYFWDRKGGKGGKCLRISKPKGSKYYASFNVPFRLEPGVRYTVSCMVKAENPMRRPVLAHMLPMDDRHEMDYRHKTVLLSTQDSFDWKPITHAFFPQEGKPSCALQFMGDVDQDFWIDDISMVPDDFPYVKRSELERERDELLATRYPCLRLLETLSHDFVTPHERWLHTPVNPMPEVLYLPMASGHSTENMQRRQIIEWCQRMALNYAYIPLLRKIERASSWAPSFGTALERYTLLRLKSLRETPKVVIVQGIDFSRHVQRAFIDQLRTFQSRGANTLFYNCTHIPQELLGQAMDMPDGLLAIPRLRRLSPQIRARGYSCYRNGTARVLCVTDHSSVYYVDNSSFECVPEDKAGEMCPAIFSHDFPYWEYINLAILKGLRYLAGVTPEAQVIRNKGNGIIVHAAKPMNVTLKAVFFDMHRGREAQGQARVRLAPGRNTLQLPMPQLPGGRHVAHYWILNQKGLIHDCGALTLRTPERAPLALTFDTPERLYTRGSPVTCAVSIGNPPPGAQLTYDVTDTHGRIVASGHAPAKPMQRLSFTILPPHTALYRLHASLFADGRWISRAEQEFSMPEPAKDLTQLDGMFWEEYSPQYQVFSNLGFTMATAYYMQDGHRFGRFNAMRHVNLEPMSWGMGGIDYSREQQLKYRGDIPSDPVRTPCYSDPEHWRKVRQRVARDVREQRFRYYGIKHVEIADEAYLGSTVCFSPHCLKGFRQDMKRQYNSLKNLNDAWNSAYRDWKDVLPVQLKDLKDRSHLAPWLDHKMFMAKVFARNWIGKTKRIMQDVIPETRMGLSGTQIPGYSYDWAQLMKHIDCISYYSGIQRKIIHDFAPPGIVCGQWGGGYAPAHLDNEFNQKSPIWEDLFLGANMLSNFAVGNSMNGDLTPVRNTIWYAELLTYLKQGYARLVLSSPEVRGDVAVLYSQPSLFAAIASIGSGFWHHSQTGCAAILDDLKYSYTYISYQDLDRNAPIAKAVILPATLALSNSAVRNLETFARNGGTVIADFGAGYFDQHGTALVTGPATRLFGISRETARLAPVTQRVSFNHAGAGFLPNLKGRFQLGESGLEAHGSDSRAAAPAGGAIFVNRIGKGQAILLNLSFGGYQAISVGGVGGELTQVKTGAETFCQQMRAIMEAILRKAGARRSSLVTLRDSKRLLPCRTTLRKDGENAVFGLLIPCLKAPDGIYPMTYHRKFTKDIHVQLPVTGHIYNARSGAYLGYGHHLDLNLMPGDGQIFTVLKDEVRKVVIDAPRAVSAGQPITIRFRAVGGSGPHVFHLDLITPRGKIARHYSNNARFSAPGGAMTFQTAFNDLPGTWTIRIRNVNTGVQAHHPLTIR